MWPEDVGGPEQREKALICEISETDRGDDPELHEALASRLGFDAGDVEAPRVRWSSLQRIEPWWLSCSLDIDQSDVKSLMMQGKSSVTMVFGGEVNLFQAHPESSSRRQAAGGYSETRCSPVRRRDGWWVCKVPRRVQIRHSITLIWDHRPSDI